MEIKFTVPGPPRGKQRPRICRINGRSVTYTPRQTIEYEKLIRARCVAALDNLHPEFDACLKTSDMHHFNVRKNASGGSPSAVSRAFFEKSIPLEISILALFPIPQHTSEKLKQLMLTSIILDIFFATNFNSSSRIKKGVIISMLLSFTKLELSG